MPGYDFRVSLTLENKHNKDLVVRIPRGSLIEPTSTSRTQQSAVVKQDYVFRLNPNEVRPVLIDAECWNQHLSPPNSVPGKITPFSGKVQRTTDVWRVSGVSPDATQLVSPLKQPEISDLVAQVGGQWARDALKFSIEERLRDVSDTTVRAEGLALRKEIDAAGTDGRKLGEIMEKASTAFRMRGSDLRAWLIRSGSLLDGATQHDSVVALSEFVALLYTYNSHDLSEEIYLVAAELKELTEDLANALTDRKRDELNEIIKRKALTIINALAEIDRISAPRKAA
jgi:hypothetical protein